MNYFIFYYDPTISCMIDEDAYSAVSFHTFTIKNELNKFENSIND